MVATNLLGRGIDVERVNVVFNYDMPEVADTYLHRVGRAGRFGTKGLAISFVSSKEDGEVLNSVQARFVVNVPELPDTVRCARLCRFVCLIGVFAADRFVDLHDVVDGGAFLKIEFAFIYSMFTHLGRTLRRTWSWPA